MTLALQVGLGLVLMCSIACSKPTLFAIPDEASPARAQEDARDAYSRGEVRFLALDAPAGPSAPGLVDACEPRLTRAEVRIVRVFADRLAPPRDSAEAASFNAEQARIAAERRYMVAFNGELAQLTRRCVAAAA